MERMKPAPDDRSERLGRLSLDRRTVLGAGVAVIGGAALTRFAAATDIGRPSGPVRFVVTDRNFTQSNQFGSAMAAYGAQALDVNDGLTALWAGTLAPHWRNPQGAVAGLTTRPVWDGLSQQAMGQFRKARLIGTHRLDLSGGRAWHDVEMPPELLSVLAGDTLDRPGWAGSMARIVGECAQAGHRGGQVCRLGDAIPPARAHHQLVSWMIV